ncbi:MAG: TlyA family RNA methyltransferase [Candidatus Aminicenantes bacterium]|nr:TlyA family RNA methyltransferase [Candidatus Aminicenantes bacterium]
MNPGNTRLDVALVERGLAPSREKAQAIIMAGEVLLNGQRCDKAHRKVSADDAIEVRERYPFVSRGAYKLERALKEFDLDPVGKVVLDIGISNGGFADLMLQKGARHVVGVDVNVDQVDWKLQCDSRVTLLKRNARYLKESDIGMFPDIITMDLSFISVSKVVARMSVWPQAVILCLIKPQFEAERHRVHKGGVIRSESERFQILSLVRSRLETLNWWVTGVCPAGIKGRRGNQEYFFRLEYGKPPGVDATILAHAVST